MDACIGFLTTFFFFGTDIHTISYGFSNPKYFREDLIRPMGEEGKDEECYALLLEPLYEKRIGLNLPSIQRQIDEDIAERREKSAEFDTPPPSPGREIPAYSILEVTNDIFRTKKRPEFHFPLWQLREAATEWVGPFGKIAGFEHGLTFEDIQGLEQARLDLEVVSEKIKRQRKGFKQARKRIKEATRKHNQELERERIAAADTAADLASEKKQEDQNVNATTPPETSETNATALRPVDSALVVVVPGTEADVSIVNEFQILENQASELKKSMKNSKQQSHDDVCVILKIVYTLEEIRREKREDYDVRVGEIEVRKEVEEWLETKHGKKAMENRIIEVKKFFKNQLKLIRDEIKQLLASKPKLIKGTLLLQVIVCVVCVCVFTVAIVTYWWWSDTVVS